MGHLSARQTDRHTHTHTHTHTQSISLAGRGEMTADKAKVLRWVICLSHTHTHTHTQNIPYTEYHTHTETHIHTEYPTDGYGTCSVTGRRTNQRKPGFKINFHP